MIIVSQDEDDIVNFNNVVTITIQYHEEYVPDKQYLISAEISVDEYIKLGLYRTEEIEVF